ncbi:MAG TPA: TlyA family RNA methyltransferase [Candidatus Binataceae bacterium]|nr:TlyA family RNA methyltransferase [Candidatus Binataceae bacterium]
MKAKGVSRERLDVEMARRGLAESRERAQRLILAGRVRVNSRPAAKPDLKVDAGAEIAVIPTRSYASRGAYKLIAALDHFAIDVAGCRALDVGASSGGFTDVLLSRGAASVIALDVGYGQLAQRLRDDPRVTVMERTNVRAVLAEDLPYRPDLVVIDTSFISLRMVLPPVVGLAASPAQIVALVKPQFEVGKESVGKGGVVRDESLRKQALEQVLAFAADSGLEIVGSLESPLTGPAGNHEFLALMRWERLSN